MKQIIVIGAGAAGMMSAWHAKTENTKVILLEALEKPGKKLLATGNGKCNLTFASEKPLIAYRGENPSFADSALQSFTQKDTVRFFKMLGMLTRERNGGIYPFTDQAQTVLSVLQQSLSDKGVRLKTRERVTGIEKREKGFVVYTESWHYPADAVILACGSKAAPALGGTDSGYVLAKQCGHHICHPLPALVPLKTAQKRLHALAGLRSQAEISLVIDGMERIRECGELQWTSYGISGIVVFQISRLAAYGLAEGKQVKAFINLLPEQSSENIYEFLTAGKNWRADRLFCGIFPEKLTAALLELCGFRGKDCLTAQQIKKVLELSMRLPVTITGTREFAYAQVCAGGVDTEEVCSQTMESKKMPGLFFAGEILDVDGACGGYNLQWAWSSGYLAGTASAHRREK